MDFLHYNYEVISDAEAEEMCKSNIPKIVSHSEAQHICSEFVQKRFVIAKQLAAGMVEISQYSDEKTSGLILAAMISCACVQCLLKSASTVSEMLRGVLPMIHGEGHMLTPDFLVDFPKYSSVLKIFAENGTIDALAAKMGGSPFDATCKASRRAVAIALGRDLLGRSGSSLPQNIELDSAMREARDALFDVFSRIYGDKLTEEKMPDIKTGQGCMLVVILLFGFFVACLAMVAHRLIYC